MRKDITINILDIEQKNNVLIKEISTFHNSGYVKKVFYPKNEDELKALYFYLYNNQIKYKVLGNGSNVLISDVGAKNIFVSLVKMKQKIMFKNNTLYVNSCTPLFKVFNHCLKRNLKGFENLALIPGRIGGSIINNASAFHQSISDYLISIHLLQNGKEKTLKKEDIIFSHHSTNLDNCIILSAKFHLLHENYEKLLKIFNKNLNYRKYEQPKGFSCGCIFKNPDSQKAGYLIDKCGLKGLAKNDAQISNEHANFIINHNNASYQDIKYLIAKCEEEVYNSFNIHLEKEIEIF